MTNYRICRISRVAYKPALASLYVRDPALVDASYDAQLQAFFDNSLIYSDSFSDAMRARGNDAIELISNAESIQKTWAHEHGAAYCADDWIREILYAQIEAIRPDVIFIQGLSTDPENFQSTRAFRERFPFVRLVVGYSGFVSPLDDLDGMDIVIGSMPFLYDYYTVSGIPTHMVYHSFDPRSFGRIGGAPTWRPGFSLQDRPHALTFTGTSGVGHGPTHATRYWELVRVILDQPLECWLDEGDSNATKAEQINQTVQMTNLVEGLRSSAARHGSALAVQALRDMLAETLGDDQPILPLAGLFPDRCHPPVYGINMLSLLGQSQITLNRHTDAMGTSFGNIRAFEATGMGACLVSDTGSNVNDIFEPDSEIVTYASVDEAVEKLSYLKEHDAARMAIAQAGQARTLREHTSTHRSHTFHEIISNALRMAA
jgi:spore maturation protein CgeB